MTPERRDLDLSTFRTTYAHATYRRVHVRVRRHIDRQYTLVYYCLHNTRESKFLYMLYTIDKRAVIKHTHIIYIV